MMKKTMQRVAKRCNEVGDRCRDRCKGRCNAQNNSDLGTCTRGLVDLSSPTTSPTISKTDHTISKTTPKTTPKTSKTTPITPTEWQYAIIDLTNEKSVFIAVKIQKIQNIQKAHIKSLEIEQDEKEAIWKRDSTFFEKRLQAEVSHIRMTLQSLRIFSENLTFPPKFFGKFIQEMDFNLAHEDTELIALSVHYAEMYVHILKFIGGC